MDFLFNNFEILAVIGLALAAWLKNRTETKQDEEGERRAREEMARHLEKVKQRPVHKTKPPEAWDTRPQAPQPVPQPPPVTQPPPLVEEPRHYEPPSVWQDPAEAEEPEPAPWEAFEQAQRGETAPLTDIHESPMLKRQREMQDRLAEIKRETAKFKGKMAGARETQRRLEQRGKADIIKLPGISSVLKDRKQTRRAIVLNEILSKPLGLRAMN